jgi:hypothetical protein
MVFGNINEEKKYSFRPPMKEGKDGKTAIVIAFGTLVLLIIAVGVFIFLTGKETTSQVSNATNVTNASNTTINATIQNESAICDDECLFNKAIADANYTFCMEIKNDSKKENCFMQLSYISLEACVQLHNYTNKKNCVEWHALSQKSTEVCNNLAVGDRKSCIEKVDPCFYKVLTEKALCMARLNKNYTYCEGDEECLLSYAELENDANPCYGIDSAVKKQVCINLVKKEDKCGDLLLASQIDYCRQLYAIRTNQSALCDKISQDTSYSYECYTHFATQEKNINYCKKLSLNDEWKCYKMYAIAANDVTGCDKIDKYASSSRYRCFLEFADTYNNASACEYVEDPGQKVECYYIAIGFNGEIYPPENCAGVEVTAWRDNCYRTLAQRTKNVTLCDYVLTEGIKKQCITAIAGS